MPGAKVFLSFTIKQSGLFLSFRIKLHFLVGGGGNNRKVPKHVIKALISVITDSHDSIGFLISNLQYQINVIRIPEIGNLRIPG